MNQNELSKIIKRLELIKNLISLEEDEDIAEQVRKLQQLQINNEVHEIINHLQQKSYGKAIVAIETLISSHNQIAIHVDPEIEALRFEAKALEAQLQQLSAEKAELEKLIYEFGVKHNRELGALIIKILKHRKEKSKGTPQEAAAEKEYEDFSTNYEATKDEVISNLTDEEQKELKSKYRKASKLCHPDVVDESQKEAAHKIFIELNEAYEKNDLKRVTEILESLQQGKIFISKSDAANEKLTLVAELNRLRLLLQKLTREIMDTKASDTFKMIMGIADWDEYFIQTKKQLEAQLNQIEDGRK